MTPIPNNTDDYDMSSEGGETLDLDSIAPELPKDGPLKDAKKDFQTEVEKEISTYLNESPKKEEPKQTPVQEKPKPEVVEIPKQEAKIQTPEKSPVFEQKIPPTQKSPEIKKDFPPKNIGVEKPTEQKAKVIGNYSLLKPVRTLKDDVENLVQNKNLSMTQIAVAESEKRGFENTENMYDGIKNNKYMIIAMIIAIVLIISGISGIYFYFQKDQVTEAPLVINSYIPVNTKKEISLDKNVDQNMRDVVKSTVRDDSIIVDSVEQIYFTKEVGLHKEVISTEDFFTIMKVRISPSLLRSISNDFTFGIHSWNGNNPFIILKTDFYQNAYAGLLAMEDTMISDFDGWFFRAPDETLGESQNLPLFGTKEKFEDMVIKNKDTRVARDSKGKIVFLYSLVDKETILITTNEDTFKEINNRLVAGKLVR